MKITVSRDVKPSSLIDNYQRLEGTFFTNIFYPEYGTSKYLRNFGKYIPDYTASHCRRQYNLISNALNSLNYINDSLYLILKLFHYVHFFKILRIRTLKTILLVLYGCETWSVSVKEEHNLQMFRIKCSKRYFVLDLRKIKSRP
jgi:hypothetical protein